MLAAKVPCAPVRELSEVMVDENMHARGSLQWVDHPELGRVVLHALAAGLRGNAAPSDRAEPAAGRLQRRAVFGEWLGHSTEELAALKDEGVIS